MCINDALILLRLNVYNRNMFRIHVYLHASIRVEFKCMARRYVCIFRVYRTTFEGIFQAISNAKNAIRYCIIRRKKK